MFLGPLPKFRGGGVKTLGKVDLGPISWFLRWSVMWGWDVTEWENLKIFFLKPFFGALPKLMDKIRNHIWKAESAQILKNGGVIDV